MYGFYNRQVSSGSDKQLTHLLNYVMRIIGPTKETDRRWSIFLSGADYTILWLGDDRLFNCSVILSVVKVDILEVDLGFRGCLVNPSSN